MLGIREGGRDLRFSVEIVLSHSTETFRRGTRLSCVSENFRWRKSFWKKGERSIKIFRRNFFVSQCRKISWGTLQCFTNFEYRKMLEINRKNFWHDSDSNPKTSNLLLENLVLSLLMSLFLNKKSWQFWSERKEKRPY